MRSMTASSPGDVVLVEFTVSDESGTKPHPPAAFLVLQIDASGKPLEVGANPVEATRFERLLGSEATEIAATRTEPLLCGLR